VWINQRPDRLVLPLALIAWDAPKISTFIQQWGELWSRTVALEVLAQTGPEQIDPILLNTWLTVDNNGLTPFELTLKVWGAYAGDSVGSRVLDAIATHVRRLAPSGTPVAALDCWPCKWCSHCSPFLIPVRHAPG
jgi:hypothetical protein